MTQQSGMVLQRIAVSWRFDPQLGAISKFCDTSKSHAGTYTGPVTYGVINPPTNSPANRLIFPFCNLETMAHRGCPAEMELGWCEGWFHASEWLEYCPRLCNQC